MSITARQVDPRDTNWEIDDPLYRVYFFEETKEIAQERRVGVQSDEWRLEGAVDVNEAIQWANDHCRGRPYVMYVEVGEQGTGLVRLRGADPNRWD